MKLELPVIDLTLTGARVLMPDGLQETELSFSAGVIVPEPVGRVVDLSGFLVLPGIIDLHGDGFERHLAPRRGAMKQMSEGLIAVEAELAANGITTAFLAQFVSWEGGLRSPEFADQVLQAWSETRSELVTDLAIQLRFETHMLDEYAALVARVRKSGVGYVVFNDHLPHDRLKEGRTPKRLVAQALKAARNPDVHLEMMQAMQASADQVSGALDEVCAELAELGVQMGSHDDRRVEDRAEWRRRGVRVTEFPETLEAAEAAKAAGDFVVLGAPNVVRGGSHNGNVSAMDLVAMGLCDALASDYHYPSPRRAALMLEATGVVDLAAAWRLVSSGPAGVMGMTDRGDFALGKRADLVVLEKGSHRVAATLSGGRFSYLAGSVAQRFIG